MKRIFVFCLYTTVILISCKTKNAAPDVSRIKVDLAVERFDKDFFGIDSNSMVSRFACTAKTKYPGFLPIFVNYILGLGPLNPDNPAAYEGSKHFLHLTKPLYDSAQTIFSNTDDIKK
ncbi:MAG: hypothetical protein WDO19_11405 [Bacteroidota bacterium]